MPETAVTVLDGGLSTALEQQGADPSGAGAEPKKDDPSSDIERLLRQQR